MKFLIAVPFMLFGSGCSSIFVEDAAPKPGWDAGVPSSGVGGGGGVPCATGEITTLAKEQAEGGRTLALDSTNVYWSVSNPAKGTAEIRTVPKSGGALTVIATVKEAVDAMVLDDLNIYWMVTSSAAKSAIYAMPKGGGSPTPLVAHTDMALAIAVDESFLYWTERDQAGVMRIPKDGSAPPVALGGGMELQEYTAARTLAADHERIVWVNGAYSAVLSMSKGDDVVTALDIGTHDEPFVLNEGRIYWGDPHPYEPSVVMSISASGGAPAKLVNSVGPVHSIAVNASCLFWVDGTRVVAADKAGGQVGNVAEVEDFNAFVVADESGAYWADLHAKVIRRLAK